MSGRDIFEAVKFMRGAKFDDARAFVETNLPANGHPEPSGGWRIVIERGLAGGDAAVWWARIRRHAATSWYEAAEPTPEAALIAAFERAAYAGFA